MMHEKPIKTIYDQHNDATLWSQKNYKVMIMTLLIDLCQAGGYLKNF